MWWDVFKRKTSSYGFVWKYGSPQIHWLIITLPIETAVWLEGISPCSDTSQNHIVGYGYHHHIYMISYLLLVKSPCFRSTALGPRSSGHRQGCTLAPNLPWYQINDVKLNSFTHSVYNNNMYIYIYICTTIYTCLLLPISRYYLSVAKCISYMSEMCIQAFLCCICILGHNICRAETYPNPIPYNTGRFGHWYGYVAIP